MSYASQSDMIARFGETEVIQLTDRASVGLIDAVVLANALDEADAEINPYLQGRYVLPMPNVPRILIGYACDIARYRLCGAAVTETEAIRARYKDAVRFLENVASGKVQLGVSVAQTPAQPNATVVVVGSNRVFTQAGMADY